MHFSALRSLIQPLLDCMLYLTQYLYDPDILPSSANQCILGNVSLRSNPERKRQVSAAKTRSELSGPDLHISSRSRGLQMVMHLPYLLISHQCRCQTILSQPSAGLQMDFGCGDTGH